MAVTVAGSVGGPATAYAPRVARLLPALLPETGK
jgi:hypothetical protein